MAILCYSTRSLSVRQVSGLLGVDHSPIKTETLSTVKLLTKNLDILKLFKKQNPKIIIQSSLRYVYFDETVHGDLNAWLFTMSLHDDSFIGIYFVKNMDIIDNFISTANDNYIAQAPIIAKVASDHLISSVKKGSPITQGALTNYVKLLADVKNVDNECRKRALEDAYASLNPLLKPNLVGLTVCLKNLTIKK